MNIFNFLFGRRLRLEDLHKIKELAEQVVLAVEQTARLPGPDKKRLALELLIDLVKESGLSPPILLLEIALEAAVRLSKPHAPKTAPPRSN